MVRSKTRRNFFNKILLDDELKLTVVAAFILMSFYDFETRF